MQKDRSFLESWRKTPERRVFTVKEIVLFKEEEKRKESEGEARERDKFIKEGREKSCALSRQSPKMI